MIENKRFTIDKDKIKDNQSPYCYIEYYKGLVPIVDLLNELAEENMMLKGENAHYKLLLMSLKETAEKFREIPKVK